jgi:hypothetical protein
VRCAVDDEGNDIEKMDKYPHLMELSRKQTKNDFGRHKGVYYMSDLPEKYKD